MTRPCLYVGKIVGMLRSPKMESVQWSIVSRTTVTYLIIVLICKPLIVPRLYSTTQILPTGTRYLDGAFAACLINIAVTPVHMQKVSSQADASRASEKMHCT